MEIKFSKNSSIHSVSRVLMAGLAMAALLVNSARAQDIDWVVAPYLWMFDTSLDLAINNDPAIGVDLPFSDAIDKLDGAFMGHVEGSGENFGVFGDILLVDLADSNDRSFIPDAPLLGDVTVNANLELRMYEIAGFYRIGDPASVDAVFDLFLGLRQVDVDQRFNFVFNGPGGGEIDRNLDISETDAFLGGRLMGQLSERWHYRARVDMGGGGTEGTLNMLGTVGYTFGDTGLFSLDIGYKYTKIDLESNNGTIYTETDIEMGGPIVGFVFSF